MKAKVAKKKSDVNKLTLLRLGSIELYKSVMEQIDSYTKSGGYELVYRYSKHYSNLPSMLRATDEICFKCMDEIVTVLELKGYDVRMDNPYRMIIKWSKPNEQAKK